MWFIHLEVQQILREHLLCARPVPKVHQRREPPCLRSAYILLVRVAVVVGGMAGFGDLLLVGDTEVPTGLSPAGRER